MRLETLIEENYDKLNENDLSVWNYILRHKKECQTMSIQELAKQCHVSHTTVSRFTHKLGMEDFFEMGQPGGGILRCEGDRAGLPGLHKDSGYDEGQGLF